jgi:pyrimidine operon attenuation protein/uracil phosphoribosyltransferase
MAPRVVLNSDDLARSLKRIAHEIIESLPEARKVLVLGIPTRGVSLAKRLTELLTALNPGFEVGFGILDVTMYRDDQVNPDRPITETQLPASGLDGEIVILVDDVLYSGRTIRAALDALVDYGRPKQVKLAVVVDRGHRELPIRPDFVGKNLPTSSQERVRVKLVEHDGIDEVVIES